MKHFRGRLSSARDNYIMICVRCARPGICQKGIGWGSFLVVEPSSAAAEQKLRSEYSGCDLSRLTLPRLEGPKSIIGQKQRHILYCREAETEEGVSVCERVSPVLSITPPPRSHITPPPPAAGDSDISGTREVKRQRRGQAGEAAAVQSSGLATDSFRKTQTPWNEELRIKL